MCTVGLIKKSELSLRQLKELNLVVKSDNKKKKTSMFYKNLICCTLLIFAVQFPFMQTVYLNFCKITIKQLNEQTTV